MEDWKTPPGALLVVARGHHRRAELETILHEAGGPVVSVEGPGPQLDDLIDRSSLAFALLEPESPSVAAAVAERIRASVSTRSTPIVVLSPSLLPVELRERLYALGAVELIQTPTPDSTLRAKARGSIALFDQARQALKEADQLRMLVQGTRDYAIFMIDPTGHVVSWNSGAEHLKGYVAHEIIGKHLSTFYPPEVAASGWIEHELTVAARTGRFEDEGWRVRKDGSRFWANVVITALRDDAGELRGFSKVTRDLTVRKQAEETGRLLAAERVAREGLEERTRLLSEQRERLHVTLASIGDAVITTDAAGNVEYLNPIAEALTNWTLADATGRPLTEVFDIVNETSRLPVPNPALRALQEGAIVGLANHTVLLARGGAEVPIDDSAAPIRDAAGRVIGSVLVFRNIAARRRTERQRGARTAAIHALASADSESAGIEGVLAAIGGQMGWFAGLAWLLDEPTQTLRCRATWARAGSDMSALLRASHELHFTRGMGLVGSVWSECTTKWIADVAEYPAFIRKAAAKASQVHSAFACPIFVGERFLGVMEFFTRHSEPFDAGFVEMAETVAGTLGQFIERRRAEAELREQTVHAETLSRITRMLAVEPDLHRLVQLVTDEATRFSGAQFGAFFYNVVNASGEAYTLYTLSGVPREAFQGFPMPRNTALFGPTFRGEKVLRLDDVTLDPRYGRNAPQHGMPAGHLPVRSYLAAAVVSRSGEVHGGLFFGHADAGVFTERHERLLVSVAAQAAVAIDNARLYQRLQASAERLNLALGAADLGDWSWDAASDIVTFSERAAEVFGIAPGPTMTWTAMQALLHPDDRERARTEVTRVIAERVQYDIEYRVDRPDGTQVWVGVLGRAQYDGDRVVGMFGVVSDVTARKTLERAQRDSEARFRSLMEQAPFSIQVLAPDGRTLRVNRAWEQLWGITLADLGDYNILQDPQLEASGVSLRIRDAFAGHTALVPPIPYDVRKTIPGLAHGHSEVQWVGAVAYPIKDESGAVTEVVLVHEDVTSRRRADEALRESEEKLRLLANTIPQLAWMAAPDGQVFWFNRPWYEYTGAPPAAVEGAGWLALIEPAATSHVRERWEHSVATGDPFEMVFPLRSARGEYRSFLTRVNPLKDDSGTVLYWFGTNTDITELRETRLKLASSEERLRLALEAGRMGVWDWNVVTGELQWSDSLEPLHGLAPGEFGGTFAHFQALIHPQDRAHVEAAIARALEQRSPFYVEFRNARRDGSLHWIAGSGKVFTDEAGAPVRMIGIGLDVTERRRAEQTAHFLAAASAALADMVDFDSTLQKVATLAVPAFADWATVDVLSAGELKRVAVAHVDSDKIRLAKELHERMPPDPQAARGAWHILRTGEPELIAAISDQMLADSAPDAATLEILRGLGLRSYIGVPLLVRGRMRGVLTFVAAESGHTYDEADLDLARDLARRTAIAIENAELYQELKDADRRKDEFLATLAHELRNPLAPIRNGLNVFRLAGDERPAMARTRTMMERQLEHLVRLVDDLLDVSRITRGRLDLRKEQVELAEVIQSAAETSRPLIEQFGHAFTVDLPTRPVYLHADRIRMAQVFSNLLNNAAKYTPAGGTIALTARVEGPQAVVAVRDNGLGIPADSLSAIFDMFAQVEREAPHGQGGLGIGLTLVRRLVELHEGSIEAHSDGPGRGSTFTVRLPVVGEPGPVRCSQGRNETSDPDVRRVLVVDDNQDAATSLEMVLSLQGNEVRTAFDGPTALDVAASFRPEVVLLDIGLPGMNGYDVCRRMREQAWGRDIVIVALTGWGQDEDRRRSQAAGFNGHLVKPIDPAQLGPLIARPGDR